MSRDVKFRAEYLRFMQEYESLDHMRLIAEEEINIPVSQRYYIPHHGIFQQSNEKSKLRVVFDASMTSNSGSSLNDILLRGPNLQLELSDILTNFRLYRYVFVSDITKMYRQILVNESFQDFQRILWRESPELPVRHYRLRTVTYGECCSPYLALRVLLELASAEENNYPAGARAIRQNKYMDDFLVGADELTELMDTRDELRNILSTAGMSLGKWASNDNRVLEGIAVSDRSCPDFSTLDETIFLKTLGIRWNPSGDYFSFNHTSVPIARLSKRSLLSEGSRIFDPLGWISPVTLLFKLLFQETWIRGVGWDEDLPADMKERWSVLRGSLRDIREVKLPRWIGSVRDSQIHGFCDASERAYAAVIYVRVRDQSGIMVTRLISSKNKLAPIKTISIAKLELCAAHLLARMLHHLQDNGPFSGAQCFAWSDSKIVLAWLATHPSKWKTFVANRCSHIQELCPGLRWAHVRSRNNPADIASRGAIPDQLIANKVWWSGPEWLSEFNVAERSKELFTTDEQQKSLVLGVVCTAADFFTDIVDRFSSFVRLTRSFSYVIRACKSFKTPSHREIGDLTPDLIQGATLILVRGVQRSYYAREVELLERGSLLIGKVDFST
ncbi:uncharacterized protein LOC122520382 [Polistes fuscatus]|uniref:uncharacterized protein LOC122520382 n=1 Tax=Polistes fuscatus TaxID=30207 RepID=UPI001CA894B1|nr:uncharacterized protein LOC122520382 [Polistes fuscatus]